MRHYPSTYTTGLPEHLAPTHALPSEEETRVANEIRSSFLFQGEGAPYMVDVIRAMRMLRGKKRYIEVGTYDKGCLAYLSKILAPDALLVDVDIEARDEHTKRLRAFMQPSQRLETVIGDSASEHTLAAVRKALGGELADVVFIDGNHMATYAWADYANFLPMVAPGGLMLFHDVYWNGTPDAYGASKATEWIDRAHPVHVIFADHPVHRFFPMFDRTQPYWGGVGIVKVAG